MTKILAINAGSSSLKFQLLEMPKEEVITSGLVERIGFEDAVFSLKFNGKKHKEELPIPNHSIAVQLLLEGLIKYNVLNNLEEISGIGHRVVHGGELFDDSVLVGEEELEKIASIADLAPLHNPANLTGIKAFKEVLPNVPAVTVFDTAFHQTMPIDSFLYPVPYEWYKNYGVRKYGFHGTSHKFVSERTAELINKPLEETKIITVHIGNGGSLAAVKGGKSIDTSMGFTPLGGIMMGTRSGNIDPAIFQYIMDKEHATVEEVTDSLNKKSGLLGVSGLSSDMRDIESGMKENNERAELAFNIFVNRVTDYIARYFVKLGGCDAIAFTAGIGENGPSIRSAICKKLAALGVKIDESLNDVKGEERLISTDESAIKVYIVPTNEEVVIARDTMRLINA